MDDARDRHRHGATGWRPVESGCAAPTAVACLLAAIQRQSRCWSVALTALRWAWRLDLGGCGDHVRVSELPGSSVEELAALVAQLRAARIAELKRRLGSDSLISNRHRPRTVPQAAATLIARFVGA